MKLSLKAIKHAPSLSEETEAFTANIYFGTKKVGYASNSGHGGSTLVRIEPEWRETADNLASRWWEVLEPSGTSKNIEPRKTVDGNMEECVDRLLSNHLEIKHYQTVKRKICFLTTKCRAGQFVEYKIKKSEFTSEFKKEAESKPDFKCWLFDLDVIEIAKLLGRDEHRKGYPLTVAVEF